MLHSFTLNIRLFFMGALLSYIALFRWLRPATYFATKVWGPLIYMIFFILLGTYATGVENTQFYVIGNAVLAAALSGIYGVTMSISGDRWEGTLPYLFGTPANRFMMFVGRAFMHILDGMLGVVIGLAWGVILFNLDLSNADPSALALTILVTTFSTAGLGLLLGGFSLITRYVMFINNTVYFLLLIFSGANVPLQNLPDWALSISRIIPLTRGIAASRLIIAGADLSQISSLLTTELMIGFFYLLAGFSLFRWFEVQAKRRGTLEAF